MVLLGGMDQALRALRSAPPPAALARLLRLLRLLCLVRVLRLLRRLLRLLHLVCLLRLHLLRWRLGPGPPRAPVRPVPRRRVCGGECAGFGEEKERGRRGCNLAHSLEEMLISSAGATWRRRNLVHSSANTPCGLFHALPLPQPRTALTCTASPTPPRLVLDPHTHRFRPSPLRPYPPLPPLSRPCPCCACCGLALSRLPAYRVPCACSGALYPTALVRYIHPLWCAISTRLRTA